MIGWTVTGTSEAFLFHQADSGRSAVCDGNSSAEAHSSYWVGMRLAISEAASCPAISSTQVVAARISPQKSFLSESALGCGECLSCWYTMPSALSAQLSS